MQAPSSLSRSQIQTLDRIYTFLRTLPFLLRSIDTETHSEATREQIIENVVWAESNRRLLVDHFPEVATWKGWETP